MGYSVLAITDREILVPHDYLNDDEFLCLHGFEMDVSQKENSDNLPFRFIKACHIGFIALEPDDKYFRITVTDKNDMKACTNGYLTKELFEE